MDIDQNSIKLLGVKIDKINQSHALQKAEDWIKGDGRHYIVTPNLEFILAAQKDLEFKKVLNEADLSIPDSSSLGFAFWLSKSNIFLKLFLWPFFFLPIKRLIHFDILTGTDLMEYLCKDASEKGFTVGFLGGHNGVAEKAAECLQKKYQNLKVIFAVDGPKVDENGSIIARGPDASVSQASALRGSALRRVRPRSLRSLAVDARDLSSASPLALKDVDILFVAFGQVKQEKWIAKNLDKIPVKVAMGVGGAFDYFGGKVPRAPKFVRRLGFEWLFRLIIEPQRIKRQLSLFKLVYLLVIN